MQRTSWLLVGVVGCCIRQLIDVAKSCECDNVIRDFSCGPPSRAKTRGDRRDVLSLFSPRFLGRSSGPGKIGQGQSTHCYSTNTSPNPASDGSMESQDRELFVNVNSVAKDP